MAARAAAPFCPTERRAGEEEEATAGDFPSPVVVPKPSPCFRLGATSHGDHSCGFSVASSPPFALGGRMFHTAHWDLFLGVLRHVGALLEAIWGICCCGRLRRSW